MLYGVTAPKHVRTNCKSCKIEQHGLLLGLITLSEDRSSDVLNSLEWSNLEERRKRHLLVTMFKIFNNNCPTYLRERFVEPLKFMTIICGVLTMISNYHYLKQIFSSAHFLIGVQWLGTNCQMKHVRWGILLALNSPYLRI